MAHPSSSERVLLARLFEQAPSFMAMLRGPTHVFELANPNYLKLVGHRDVIGKTVLEALPDAVDQGYLDLLDKVYATGVPYSAHSARYLMQPLAGGEVDERYVDFVFQPVRDVTGAIEGIFVEGVDSTDRVLAHLKQEKLFHLTDRFSEILVPAEIAYIAAELLGTALGVSRVGFGSIDHQADTLEVEKDWCAPGVETLAGVTRLRDYGSFIDSLKRNEFISIADVREDPRTAPASAALESKSARSFVNVPVLEGGVLVAVFFVNSDVPRRWAAHELELIRDVGQRTHVSVERARASIALKASEARLREANETLEARVSERTAKLMAVEAQFRQSQKMEAVGQLTGGIAHDFNNLLHSMSMSLEVLKRKLTSEKLDGWERYMGMCSDALKRAASLTHRLLAFSRQQTLDPRPTDVGALIAGMEELIKGTVGPAIDLVMRPGEHGIHARIDRSQLENALLNLCINARDAMRPAGGVLTIEPTQERTGPDPASEGGEEYAVVSIRDTGCGMTEQVLARAFDPFFTTKPLGQGTGLGLSMVYGFVQQSGGFVRINSKVGRGTDVRIYLPCCGPESEEDSPVGNVVTAAASGAVVLVVEDEPSTRQMLGELLGAAGYQVLAAADGAQALEVLGSSRHVDLLVTDVGLPGGMNGRQVADAARATRSHLGVIFITGYAEVDVLRDAQLPARTAVITKPFESQLLLAKAAEITGTAGRG